MVVLLATKDIANVKENWSKSLIERYRKNKRSVNITISNTETQDILFIANYVKDYVRNLI